MDVMEKKRLQFENELIANGCETMSCSDFLPPFDLLGA